MRPICSDEEYSELVVLTDKFRLGIGRRLQRYLLIKRILSVNYVTDWWEEFVYLRQRSPIMINSNYYGFDALRAQSSVQQSARAANLVWIAFQFRRMVERQEITPVENLICLLFHLWFYSTRSSIVFDVFILFSR